LRKKKKPPRSKIFTNSGFKPLRSETHLKVRLLSCVNHIKSTWPWVGIKINGAAEEHIQLFKLLLGLGEPLTAGLPVKFHLQKVI